MTSELLVKVGFGAFAFGGAGGLWLLLHEMDYATTHAHSELSGVLEVAALALIAVAVGGIAAVNLLKRSLSVGANSDGR